jgi:NodT family efflux transporter outer membrane factor (OMF) lipoprotein
MTRVIRWLKAALLTGCTVGPDYHVPEQATVNDPRAQQPFLGAAHDAFETAALPDHWWRLYRDPRLDRFVEEGLEANRDLRTAQANLSRATYVVTEARAARLPATNLAGSVGLSTPVLPRANGIPLSGVYSLGGNVSYPLDLAGGIRRAIEAARASEEATQAVRDEVRTTVAAAITRNYIAACSANRTLATALRVLDIEKQTLSATERLFKGGRSTAFDVTRAQAAVDASAATIPPILAERTAAIYSMTALMGRLPVEYPREMEGCREPPPLIRTLPVGDGAALIRRRADIRAAERELAVATASVGIETAALYPAVSLGGSVGMGGLLSSFSMASQVSFSVGPLVTWTFPNRVVAHARIAEAGAAAEAASATFDSVVIGALRDTETALNAYVQEYDRNDSLRRARDSAIKANDQAWRLFRFGRTDFLSVLSAQGTLATAESTLASSNATLIDNQINVFVALGGGWGEDDNMVPLGERDNATQKGSLRDNDAR